MNRTDATGVYTLTGAATSREISGHVGRTITTMLARAACRLSLVLPLARSACATPFVARHAAPLAVTNRLRACRMCTGPDRTVVDTCKTKIAAALEPAELEVKGAFDDPNGSHIAIYCVSDAFEGKRSLQRQQARRRTSGPAPVA